MGWLREKLDDVGADLCVLALAAVSTLALYLFAGVEPAGWPTDNNQPDQENHV